MLDPLKIHEIEQAMQSVREVTCPFYWALYEGCQEQGFTKAEAMDIVIAQVQKYMPPESE